MAQESIYRSDYPIIYVYGIDDERHKGALKIGKASIKLSAKEVLSIDPCDSRIETAAKACIKGQTNRSATLAEFKYAELAFYIDEDGDGHHFMDTYVHMILGQNGFEKKEFPDMDGSPQEWYICHLEDVKAAIRTIKSGHHVMKSKKSDNAPIVFREEQNRAIRETIEQFKVGDKMLWNAKMRFGKTLCSLELIRQQKYKKTLIVTHRPAVRDGWFNDYELLDFTGYAKGCKLAETSSDPKVGETFATLQRDFKKNGTKYIYFASMQDLRGGDDVKAGGINKNHEIFADNWDLIIVDEAHEGTQTNLGKNVLDALKAKHPKVLYLSGTPFNILHKFSEKEIFTWDYNMEQRAKEKWYEEHPGEPNDYAELPCMNIRTFRLRDNFEQYYKFDEDYFNFAELFRTWTGDETKDAAKMPSTEHKGKFVHENDVRAFLDLMHKQNSLYPFSTAEYQELFAHTFWVVPGVKEAKALSALLQEKGSWWQAAEHRYEVVNVAGDGDDPTYDRDDTKKNVEKREKKEKDALEKVKKAIEKHPRTITISCGRLTTGVTVKPWTGVFMLKGNGETKAAFYMQTIFRAQSPCKAPFKTDCYAFDFAPDRTVTVIDEYLKSQPNNKDRKKRSRETVITEFLNFCSVISIDGSTTTEFDTREFITQVNRAYKECIIRQGFKGRQLYVDLYQLSDADKLILESVNEALKGTKTSNSNNGKVTVNDGGTNPKDGKKRNKNISPIKSTNTNAERKKLRDRYQVILDTLSVRLPMMVFGEVESLEHFDMETFVDGIENVSWEVFMPKGITKNLFKSLLHLYNTDAILASFNDILLRTHEADTLPIAERAMRIADLLATFHFPDKETVLTPWRVVNMHMTNTLGGYDFYDEQHVNQLTEPRFVSQGEITDSIFADPGAHVLEINAKSGVYPLWLAYTFYRYREEEFKRTHGAPPNNGEQEQIWQIILRDNIFVLCMSPMAVKITERALSGYHNYQVNCKHQQGLLEILKNEDKQNNFVKRVKKYSYWGNKNMRPDKFEFKAVVGNPPYQETRAGELNKANSAFATALYPYFVNVARAIDPQYISLITPSRWMTRTGQGVSDEWVDSMIQENHISLLHDFIDATECFKNVEIKGGVCYYLLMPQYNGECKYLLHRGGNIYERIGELNSNGIGIVVRDEKAMDIINKIIKTDKEFPTHSFATYVGPQHFFDKDGLLTTSWSDYALKKDTSHNIKYYLNKTLEKSGYAWIRISDIPKNVEVLQWHKVFIPKVGGTGNDPYVLGKPFYGEPNSVCSQTYIVIGYDQQKHKFTKEMCINIINYIKTRFFRYLVSIKKKTQDNPSSVFQFVPLQDFTSKSDIEWSKSVSEIDQQLYTKYNLSEKEVAFIEEMIKPME